MRRRLLLAAVLATLVSPALQAQPGRVVVLNDEWTFSDSFFGANERRFLGNVLSWFNLGARNALVASSNFGYGTNFGAFVDSVNGAGSLVRNSSLAPTGFGVVFVGGTATTMSNADLLTYVANGGNVVLLGGTAGFGGGAGESAYWAQFLGAYGLGFATTYNGIAGSIATTAWATQGPFGPTLFSGVGSLYQNNGSTIVGTGAPQPGVTAQLFSDGANGLYAAVSVVPEPSTWALVATGLLLVAVVAPRRRAARARA